MTDECNDKPTSFGVSLVAISLNLLSMLNAAAFISCIASASAGHFLFPAPNDRYARLCDSVIFSGLNLWTKQTDGSPTPWLCNKLGVAGDTRFGSISKFQYETQSTYFLLLASQNPKEALNGLSVKLKCSFPLAYKQIIRGKLHQSYESVQAHQSSGLPLIPRKTWLF